MTLEEYAALPYVMTIEADPQEGGYVVSFPDLPGCLTCGDTIESALQNAVDAKRVWLEAALEGGQAIPLPDDLSKYSGQIRVRLPRTLHRRLAAQSRREGISMNQYIIYQLAGALASNPPPATPRFPRPNH
jgi:predicted RNase H-like HicB family nuclease